MNLNIKRFRGVFTRQRALVLLGVLFFIGWVGGGYYYFFVIKDSSLKNLDKKVDTSTVYGKEAVEISKEELPGDPQQAVFHYMQLGMNLEQIKNYDLAIDAYKKGQVITEKNPELLNGTRFYVPIARVYLLKGDKSSAVKFFNLEISYGNDHLDVEGMKEVVEALQKKVKELNGQ